jgi:tetratricopeptide (TPR) repeat protein
VLVLRASLRMTPGDLDGAMAAGQQALELAATLGDPALQAEASFGLGRAYFGMGDFSRAAEVLRWTLAVLARGTPGPECYVEIRSGAWLAQVLSMLGEFAEGRRHGEAALRLAMEGGHPWAVIGARACLGYLYLTQGDLKAAIHMLDRGLTLARASGHRAWSMAIAGGLGEAYAQVGRLAEGHTLLEEACRDAIGTGALAAYAIHLSQLSAVDLLAGRVEEAWQHADQACDLARQQKTRGGEARALFQLGAVHAHATPPDVPRAEVRYQEALTLAEPLRMRPLQAHCHRGLGTLYLQMGRRAEARAELSIAIELYRAMAMTFWLPQAEAALAQVEDRDGR